MVYEEPEDGVEVVDLLALVEPEARVDAVGDAVAGERPLVVGEIRPPLKEDGDVAVAGRAGTTGADDHLFLPLDDGPDLFCHHIRLGPAAGSPILDLRAEEDLD